MTRKTPRAARRRPWRLTYIGGKVLGTFSTKTRAVDRARELVYAGKADRLWVRRRGTTKFEEVRIPRGAPMFDQHPFTAAGSTVVTPTDDAGGSPIGGP
jgi:hypothetical protein